MASFPNRCQEIKVNGTQCGSPALTRKKLCYFHERFREERERLAADKSKGASKVDLPTLEDANSIQLALRQIMRLIIAGQIDSKQAGLLLYALQTASFNLRRTDFRPLLNDVVLNPRQVAATPLNGHVWEDEEFDDEFDDEEEGREPPEHAPAEIHAAATAKSALPPRRPPGNVSIAEVRQNVREIILNSKLLKPG